MARKISRRDFFKLGGAAGAGILLGRALPRGSGRKKRQKISYTESEIFAVNRVIAKYGLEFGQLRDKGAYRTFQYFLTEKLDPQQTRNPFLEVPFKSKAYQESKPIFEEIWKTADGRNFLGKFYLGKENATEKDFRNAVNALLDDRMRPL